jgi:hypothetical protein
MKMQPQPKAMTKRRWFWAWQDEKEEAWLEAMAREGWHLREVGVLRYTFERGAPQEWVYRLDFRTSRETPEYIAFVEGAGWEYIGKMSSWLYFRAPVSADAPAELYTDAEGKISKYQRIIGILVIFSPAYWVVLVSRIDRFSGWVAVPIALLFAAVAGLYAFVMFKLISRINQLKRT